MLSIFLVLVFVGGLVLAVTFWFQDRLIFFPDPRLDSTPRALGLAYEDVEFTASDGVALHGWFLSGPDNRNVPVALFCHGNAGNISHRLEQLRIIHDLGLACLIFDYRGYGRSQGRGSEKGIYRDVAAAWSYLTETRKVAPDRIICWGRSLGGAVAAHQAATSRPGALIIESAFTSLPALGQKLYPFLPVRLLARYRFPVQDFLQNRRCPLLIVHSREDEIVPFAFGRRLFEQAPGPKTFLELAGGHNEGFLVSGTLYTRGLADFLSSVRESGWPEGSG